VIDGTSNTVVATVVVGGGPSAIGVDPTTDRIFVADHLGITVIDGTTNTVLGTLAKAGCCSIAVDPTTDRVYTVSDSGSSLTVIQG
jgi:DNA-binding beta-propeller fold protein YncE